MLGAKHGLPCACLLLLFSLPNLVRAAEVLDQGSSACGRGWQDVYRQLHKEIITGVLPPRYVLARVGLGAGLADSLTGIMTAFYFALLTERALIIDLETMPHLTEAYDEPNIQWSHKLPASSQFTTYSMNTSSPICNPLIELSDASASNPARTEDMSRLGKGADVVIFEECFAGNVVKLFSNPHHRNQLFTWGLRPDTSYGCAHHFLYSVSRTVKEAFSAEYEQLHDHRAAQPVDTIGIHLRTFVDSKMQNFSREVPSHTESEAALEPYKTYFTCAEQVQEQLANASRPSQWYFISDDVYLRRAVKSVYGDKVVVNVSSKRRPQHVSRLTGGGAAAMIAAAGEFWLYSLADHHIFSTGGFGRSSFLTSLKWEPRMVAAGCTVAEFSFLAKLPPYI